MGARLAAGGAALILEAMKMEISVESEHHIEIIEVLVTEGSSVRAGQALVIAKLIQEI
jgi:biotin carboxyl carrier protein